MQSHIRLATSCRIPLICTKSDWSLLSGADLCSPVAPSSDGTGELCPVGSNNNTGVCPDAQAGQQCFEEGEYLKLSSIELRLLEQKPFLLCLALHVGGNTLRDLSAFPSTF